MNTDPKTYFDAGVPAFMEAIAVNGMSNIVRDRASFSEEVLEEIDAYLQGYFAELGVCTQLYTGKDRACLKNLLEFYGSWNSLNLGGTYALFERKFPVWVEFFEKLGLLLTFIQTFQPSRYRYKDANIPNWVALALREDPKVACTARRFVKSLLRAAQDAAEVPVLEKYKTTFMQMLSRFSETEYKLTQQLYYPQDVLNELKPFHDAVADVPFVLQYSFYRLELIFLSKYVFRAAKQASTGLLLGRMDLLVRELLRIGIYKREQSLEMLAFVSPVWADAYHFTLELRGIPLEGITSCMLTTSPDLQQALDLVKRYNFPC